MPILNHSFFSTTYLYKQCLTSGHLEHLLVKLARQLEDAWNSLIPNDEAESLMIDVNNHINLFNAQAPYPVFHVKGNDFRDRCQQTVKYASVYAGLAAIAVHDGRFLLAKQLIADSLLMLFRVYRPRSEEAYNNYVSRKGGAARSAQRRPLRDELYSLMEQEICTRQELFNTKKEAAEYFAKPLNEAAKRLNIKNIRPSMNKTIQTWFSKNKELMPLIEKLISPRQKRKR